MKLPEYRGKELLRRSGVRVPPGIVTDNKSYINLSFHKERYREFFFEHGRVVIKAQVLSGGRKKNGLIVTADDYARSLEEIDALYKRDVNGQPVTTLLIEKQLAVKEEYYLSILYDTVERKPMILLSSQGGVDVEESVKREAPASIHVSPMDGLHEYQARALAKAAGFTGRHALSIAL
ncbi:succinate--CoA ligase subunit beta, partial [Candidatus Woesearchaeota archaeon]